MKFKPDNWLQLQSLIGVGKSPQILNPSGLSDFEKRLFE